jgi:hypothetical protein
VGPLACHCVARDYCQVSERLEETSNETVSYSLVAVIDLGSANTFHVAGSQVDGLLPVLRNQNGLGEGYHRYLVISFAALAGLVNSCLYGPL